MFIQILSLIVLLALVFTNTACSTSKGHVKKRMAQEQVQGTYVRQIIVSGFILRDKQKIDGIILPYQKKYLTSDQINGILKELSSAYLEAGFAGLVSIHYELHKGKLLISIELKK